MLDESCVKPGSFGRAAMMRAWRPGQNLRARGARLEHGGRHQQHKHDKSKRHEGSRIACTPSQAGSNGANQCRTNELPHACKNGNYCLRCSAIFYCCLINRDIADWCAQQCCQPKTNQHACRVEAPDCRTEKAHGQCAKRHQRHACNYNQTRANFVEKSARQRRTNKECDNQRQQHETGTR